MKCPNSTTVLIEYDNYNIALLLSVHVAISSIFRLEGQDPYVPWRIIGQTLKVIQNKEETFRNNIIVKRCYTII